MPEILQEYLISLGTSIDEPAFRKLTTVVTASTKSIEDNVGGMAKMLLEAQASITAGFASVGAGVVGLAAHLASEDQKFRLFGQTMLMGLDSARKLSMITSTLGLDLKQIAWDRESSMWAVLMGHDIDTVMTALDPARVERAMVGIRTIGHEFDRLKISAELLELGFTSRLFERLFPDASAVKEFSDWIDHFQKQIPELADKLSGYMVPILKDAKDVLAGLIPVGKESAVVFQNLVALLSGDSSLEGTTASLDKMARAFQHVVHWAARLVETIEQSEMVLLHFASGTALALSGHWTDAAKEFKSAQQALTPASGSVLGASAGVPLGATIGGLLGAPLGPLGVAAGAGIGSAVGGVVGAAAGYGEGSVSQYFLERDSSKSSDTSTTAPAPKQEGSGLSGLLTEWFASTNAPTATPETQPQKLGDRLSGNFPTEQAAPRENLVDAIANAITNYEAGHKPNPISVRQNNPGNLRSWGDYPVKNGYVEFPDWATGMSALHRQIEKNIGRGLNLEQFFAGKEGVYPGFAPSADSNNPEKYAKYVGARIHVDTTTPLNQIVSPAVPGVASHDFRSPAPAPAQQSFLQHFATEAPTWLQAIPKWFDELPAWFSSAPTWWNQTPAAGTAAQHAPAESTTKYLAPQPVIQNYLQRAPAPDVAPPSVTNQTIGDLNVTVNVTQPNASPAQIQQATTKAIRDAMQLETHWDLVQLNPSY